VEPRGLGRIRQRRRGRQRGRDAGGVVLVERALERGELRGGVGRGRNGRRVGHDDLLSSAAQYCRESPGVRSNGQKEDHQR
jgi:hypothetical protein